MIPFNIKNKRHQYWMVLICLMNYTAGDPKDIYEDEQYEQFKKDFDLKNDDETTTWLERPEHRNIYEDITLLKIMPNSNHLDEPEY